MRRLHFLAVILLLFAADCFAQSGLLLGLKGMDAASPPFEPSFTYRTIFIRSEGNTITVLDAPDLLVPRANGFWRVGGMRTCTPLLDEEDGYVAVNLADELWAVPVEKAPTVSTAETCADARREATKAARRVQDSLPAGERLSIFVNPNASCEYDSATITFVNPSVVATGMRVNYDCGMHPDAIMHSSVASLDDWYPWPHEEGPPSIAFSSVVPDGGRQLFDNAAKESGVHWSTAAEGPACPFESSPDTEWLIYHDQGRWVPQGYVATHRLCGYGNQFPLRAELPASLVGANRMAIPFPALKEEIPDLVDAVSSPDGQLLVVLTAEAGRIYRPHDGQIGPPLASFHLARYGKEVVMTEWSYGGHTARWENEVRQIRKRGLPRPAAMQPKMQ